MITMNKRQTNMFLYLFEGMGAAFVAVFCAAYLFALPTMNVLHSEPTFKLLLSVFGVIFLALIGIAVVLAVATKQE
ncbi:MAG: hypothetical protein WC325_01180 [Candidatus Bathyarchaeia archaeon]